ncbi:MAG: NCS2 family permease [Armatimonadota bacterium]|nr:NCS2 family permease [bacterium]MDW8320481.1 NCS2 family permease [Armatimonadota bacterium]
MATTYSPSSASHSTLNRLFALDERGSTAQREVIAGLATFMTMAYIIFVNPQILKTTGIPVEAAAAATCIAAAIPTLIMGLWANYPFALASGMGLNAALAMHAAKPGMDWQTMMGVIVVEGAIVTLLVLTRVREQVMQAIPINLKRAIGVGIGIFIAFLGLQHAGWVLKGPEGVYLTHGAFTTKGTLVSTIGILLMMLLLAFRVRGAILLGILATAAIAWIADAFTSGADRLTAVPERWLAMPDFSTFGQANILGALQPALIGVIFAFLITDFFDTMGTVIGIGGQAGFLDQRGNLPRLNRVLLTDSLAAVWGGLCGASSVTTYIESAAGISEGGRTGLTAVVVSVLFLLSLLFAPLVGVVPAVATAPALIIVGYLMMSVVREMDFETPEHGIPAFLTMLLIPLTQSISFGIGVGFISYVAVMLLRGKGREVSPWMYGIALLFALSFAWGI